MALGFGRRRFRRAIRKNTRNPLTQRRRKYYKKKLRNKDQVLVNYTKPSLNMPINPRFLTKFTYSLQGQVGTLAGSRGYFAIKLNSPRFPGDTAAYIFTGSNNLDGTLAADHTSLAAGQSRGFSNLVSASMYQKWRVYASSIKVSFIPNTQADASMVVVYPVTNIQGVGPLAVRDTSVAYSKEKVAMSGADGGSSTIKHYIDLQSLLGLSKEQIMANENLVGQGPSTSFPTGQDPSNLLYWIVSYKRLNDKTDYSTTLGSRPSIAVEVTYYTELFEMNYDTMNIA